MEEKDARKNSIEIFCRLKEPLLYMLKKKFRVSKYTAEDIYHDSFISFYLSLDKLQDFEEKVLVGWIYKVVLNKYVSNFYVKNRNKSLYIDKVVNLSLQDDSIEARGVLNSLSSLELLLQREYLEEEFMLGLNRDQKKIYKLLYEGYTLDEISKKFRNKNYREVSKIFNQIKNHGNFKIYSRR
jgi:DNA-directed RNA polymerase specialized sigma24 family protein